MRLGNGSRHRKDETNKVRLLKKHGRKENMFYCIVKNVVVNLARLNLGQNSAKKSAGQGIGGEK